MQKSCTDIFYQLFSEELIRHIVFQTNLYYVQTHGGYSTFVSTTDEKMQKFLAVNLLMGIKQMPS